MSARHRLRNGACALLAVATTTVPAASGELIASASAATAPHTRTIVIGRNAMLHGYGATSYALARGGVLKVTNADSVRHTVTAVSSNSHGSPLFDTSVAPGTTVTVAGVPSLKAGSYAFYCRVHPGMRATLKISGTGGSAGAGTVSFSQPLVFPAQITSANPTITMKRGSVRIMPTGPKTSVIGYDGTYPGPTLRRRTGSATRVTFVNALSSGSYSVHLHGDHHAASSDGQPDSYLVGPGQRRTYSYPLRDHGVAVPPSFSFYHDHVMGLTGRDNWDGLQGMMIVDDGREASLGLPTGSYDRPLMISERTLTSANQLVPVRAGTDGRPTIGATAPPGDATVGNRVLVNGRWRPYFDVNTHQYRLRLLNASNFTSYDLMLTGGRPFLQVGTGSSLLPHPMVRHDILLGPAQRADVVVDFRGLSGKKVNLWSVARRDGSRTGVGTPTVPIMQFRVTHKVADTGHVHPALEATPAITVPGTVSATWRFGLGGSTQTGQYWTVNGKAFDPTRVDLVVPLGSTQRWRLVNTSTMTHYVHLHEEQWHTVLRDGKAPPAYERGLQDTWRLDPGESVEVAARFTDYTGVFMIHCHMLDHEDDGMMAQFAVEPTTTSALPAGYSLAGDTTADRTMGSTTGRLGAGSMDGMPGMATSHDDRDTTAASTAPGGALVHAGIATAVLSMLFLLGTATLRQRARTRSS